MKVRSFLILVGLALGLAGCGDSGQQPQNHFHAALANNSTAPSLVRIELIQDGKPRILCVYAEDLIDAVMTERRLRGQQGYENAVRLAKANKRHRFAFQKPEALKALDLDYDEQERQQGCAIIARGQPAFREDMSGEISEGHPFGKL